MNEKRGSPRPGPVRWLLYVYGAGLPPRYREWVLHDVTARTWVLRHLIRATVQMAPLGILIYLALPGPVGIRLASVFAGVLLGFFYSFAYIHETAEHRAVKAGYPPGTVAAIHAARNAAERAAQERRYAEAWRTESTPD